jgi:hypothetical protein
MEDASIIVRRRTGWPSCCGWSSTQPRSGGGIVRAPKCWSRAKVPAARADGVAAQLRPPWKNKLPFAQARRFW